MNEISISVVSPVYKAENILDELVEEIVIHVGQLTENYELILVDDGSPGHERSIRSFLANAIL